jgi:hypothetical protein
MDRRTSDDHRPARPLTKRGKEVSLWSAGSFTTIAVPAARLMRGILVVDLAAGGRRAVVASHQCAARTQQKRWCYVYPPSTNQRPRAVISCAMVVSIAGITVCPGALPPPQQRRRHILISGLVGHLRRQAATDHGARQRLLDLAEDGESAAQTG